MPTNGVIRHDTDHHRYEWVADNQVVGVLEYRVSGGRIEMHHTHTVPARRGRGIAARLVGAALDDVRTRDLRVVATCWYVAEYIDTHPEYRDLLAFLRSRLRGMTKRAGGRRLRRDVARHELLHTLAWSRAFRDLGESRR